MQTLVNKSKYQINQPSHKGTHGYYNFNYQFKLKQSGLHSKESSCIFYPYKAALRKQKKRDQGYRVDVKNLWNFHMVKCEHEVCDNLTKKKRERETGTCAQKSVCVSQFSSLMAWSALVMQLRELSFSCSSTPPQHTHTRTHAHTHNLETAFDLHSSQFSHDTYPHTPVQAHTHTHTHTVQRNCPPNYLVSLGADSSKRREGRRRGGGRRKRREERRKRKGVWEKKGTAATLKWDLEKNYYCWEKVEKERGQEEEEGRKGQSMNKTGECARPYLHFHIDIFSYIWCRGSPSSVPFSMVKPRRRKLLLKALCFINIYSASEYLYAAVVRLRNNYRIMLD